MTPRLVGLCCCAVLSAVSSGASATEVFNASTINYMDTYQSNPGTWTAPDTIFLLTSGSVGSCVGFWLSPSDPGYQANFATLLAAKLAERAIKVYALDTVLWGGSTDHYCRVDMIRLP